MIDSGLHQWNDGYPSGDDVLNDINNGVAHVLTIDNEIAVYGAVILNGEPCYDTIAGNWQTNGNYYVIHRFATLPEFQREGLAQKFIRCVRGLCEVEQVPSIKVDTHIKNFKMIGLLSSLGFCYCGIIDYGTRGTRAAFEYVTLNMDAVNNFSRFFFFFLPFCAKQIWRNHIFAVSLQKKQQYFYGRKKLLDEAIGGKTQPSFRILL